MKRFIALFISFSASMLFAQEELEIEILLQWSDTAMSYQYEEEALQIPTFQGAVHEFGYKFAPQFIGKFEVGKAKRIRSAELIVDESVALSREGRQYIQNLDSLPAQSFQWAEGEDRGKTVLLVHYFPIIESGRGYEAVHKARIVIRTERAVAGAAKSSFASESVLSNGEWYKIGVTQDGIHRIDRSLLQSMGINVSNLNPQEINIFGNGYGQLPFFNFIERPDDLLINNIFINGEQDASFDEGDFILFYAKGPHTWAYDESNGRFEHNKHDYSDTSYYFIGINTGLPPARVSNLQGSSAGSNYLVEAFDDYTFHEVDRENLLKSGRQWFGEKFDVQTTYNFSGSQFNFPNRLSNAETNVRCRVVSRRTASGSGAVFTLSVNGQSTAVTIPNVGTGVASNFANIRSLEVTLGSESPGEAPIGNAPPLNINIQYDKNGSPSASGWLDWISVNTRRLMRMSGNQMHFRDSRSIGPGRVSRFELDNAASVQEIWEVSDPTQARRVSLNREGALAHFTLATEGLREFIAFTGNQFFTPVFHGSVSNQNLHALGTEEPIDMIIVSPSQLASRAEDLANIHRNYEADPLRVEVVGLQAVYNEFSSGMRDITAIKWLMKMLYDRAGGNEAAMPRYLLLFGDGSFDNRNTTPGNTNLVPTYQSLNSLSPVNSYVSDDYFGFLGDNEGESQLDVMDIGIGRLTVKSLQEATSVVNKIRRYVEVEGNIGQSCSICDDQGGGFGPWRNIISLVADDEDGNSHMRNSNTIASQINSYTQDFNLERIFIDAFQQIATPGGSRYPDVNRIIDRRVRNGCFIINYIGHGGVVGWAQERILDVPTILAWDNQYALPIFMTATCEFTRFDDPLRTSAGEYVLLNGNGGGIALLTTTRLVYSAPNFALNENFYDALFLRPENEIVTRLGDVSRDTKNASLSATSANHRNFSLIGDPALPMAIPRQRVNITAITDTLGNEVDTLKALAVVRVSGEVTNAAGNLLGDFQGLLNATVFDREKDVVTLANDGGNPFEFRQQEDVVHRGNAEVINGRFTFDFVIPKDISFSVDSTARISLYAFSETEDGRGFQNDLLIGDRDTSAVDDGTGPDIELFLNDENFVFGGFTNSTPTLISRVFDKSGINTVGTGVGHDITAVLDNDPNKTFILNDFYESDLNTFRSGRIVYPFDEIERGEHELSLKVWNVHNRSSEAKTAFIVADSEEFAIERVLNYPNPFTTRTEFYFEHNQSCAFLNVMIQIFTVSGKLVKSIVTVSNTDGFRNEPIPWDGRDDFGDRLATGVYVYKVSVRNPAGDQVEEYEKLVILN